MRRVPHGKDAATSSGCRDWVVGMNRVAVATGSEGTDASSRTGHPRQPRGFGVMLISAVVGVASGVAHTCRE